MTNKIKNTNDNFHILKKKAFRRSEMIDLVGLNLLNVIVVNRKAIELLYRPSRIPPYTPLSYNKTGVCSDIHIFIILLQNIDCGYLLELPRRGGSNVYLQSMSKNKKNI